MSTHLIKYKRRGDVLEEFKRKKSYKSWNWKQYTMQHILSFGSVVGPPRNRLRTKVINMYIHVGCAWISNGGGASVVRIRARSALDYVGQDVTSCTSVISGLASSLAKGHSLPPKVWISRNSLDYLCINIILEDMIKCLHTFR